MGLFQIQNSQNRLAGQVKQVFSYLMIFVYIGFGLFLIIKGWYSLSNTQNISIGVLLIGYSIFRAVRVIKETKVVTSDEELSDK
jgi:hypothetical protein